MPELDDDRPTIVDPTGRRARDPESRRCPTCGAGPEQRVSSSGFGQPHDVCRRCGHEFAEDTVGRA